MRPRIRTVKPEIFHDEDLWDLGVRTGMPVYQGFQGLWCYADREGRFEWRPKALKALILPYWEGDFGALLEALLAEGMLARYDVRGRQYGLVVNLKIHQAINAREPASRLPPPPPGTCTHVRARAQHGGIGIGNGNGTDLSLSPEGAEDRESELPAQEVDPDDDEPEPPELGPDELAPELAPAPARRAGRRGSTRDPDPMLESYPEGWRAWSAETTRAATAHGLTAKDLAGHVDYWTTRAFPGGRVRSSMLDLELRRDLEGIAKRKAHAAVKLGLAPAKKPGTTWIGAEHRRLIEALGRTVKDAVDGFARQYPPGMNVDRAVLNSAFLLYLQNEHRSATAAPKAVNQ